MLIFFASLAILLLGYKFYSPFVEKQAGIDPTAITPQQRLHDGVDYVPISPMRASRKMVKACRRLPATITT